MGNLNYNAGGYWISPIGKVYVVGFARHDETSCELVKEFFADKYDVSFRTYVSFLISRRWIHISGQTVDAFAPPTNEQYEALLDLAKHTNDAKFSENLVSVAFR